MSQKLSLKLKPPPHVPKSEPQDSPPLTTPSSGTTKIKLKVGKKQPSQSSAPADVSSSTPAPAKAKPGRKPKPTPKKRALEEDPETGSTDDEPGASTSTARPAIKKLKLITKGAAHAPTSADTELKTPKNLKLKTKGKPPKRPKGVGYDSEASDREDDPMITESVILRMLPGPDCDLLRATIANGNFGKAKEGGVDVRFKFLAKDGRRACIHVRGNMYAAILVDLPCIIEGMKSWYPKNGWMKSVDICQMLMVLAPIKHEEEAANFPIPSEMLDRKELDEKTWQWAHGITPPLHWVRKRRFRKRISVNAVMEVENEVEELLRKDELCEGDPEIEIIQQRQMDDSAGGTEPDDDEDAYGEQDYDYEEEDEETRNARIAADFEREMAGAAEADMDESLPLDDQPLPLPNTTATATAPSSTNPSFDSPTAAIPPPLPQASTTSTPASFTAAETPASLAGTPTAAAAAETSSAATADTPGGASSPASSSSSDDDNEDEDEDDEDKAERQQDLLRQKEEISDLEAAIRGEQAKLEGTGNALLKRRLVEKIRSLKGDLDVKVAALGG